MAVVWRILSIAAVTALIYLLLVNSFVVFDKTAPMLKRSSQTVLAAVGLASVAHGQQVLDLSTVDWTLTSPNFSYISVPGKVPSQVHLDLHAARVCAFFPLIKPD